MNKLLFTIVCSLTLIISYAQPLTLTNKPGNEQLLALNRIDALSKGLQQSEFYIHVSVDTFISQLIDRIKSPYKLKQGKTFFCWAAAPIAYLYDKAPIEMVEAVFNLYKNGEFTFSKRAEHLHFYAEKNSALAVGTETFRLINDPLANRVVDQMVLLAFADHYKCWINIDRRFHPGDQTKSIWAGATLNKEKKVWRDFGFNVEKYGFDLFWWKKDKAGIVKQSIDENKLVVLYVNAAYFNKKWDRLRMIRRKPPFILTGSHYILVQKIESADNEYKITFWDDDGLQQLSLSYKLFQRSVFGIAAITKQSDADQINMLAMQ